MNDDTDRMATLDPRARLAHSEAERNGEETYADPTSGYRVFTRTALLNRERCCGSGCRHCPYGKGATINADAPRLMLPEKNLAELTGPVTVLFWSGGKDSLLALRRLVRSRSDDDMDPTRALNDIVLLTTFDQDSMIVAHQEIALADIEKQAAALGAPLLSVPLSSSDSYENSIERALRVVEAQGGSPTSLAFGDLHLAHVRNWREEQLGGFGLQLSFPVWGVPYADLLADLERCKVPCTISAHASIAGLEETFAAPNGSLLGRRFDRDFAARAAAAGWDAFGEDGEFHTLAQIWQAPAQSLRWR